MDASAKTRATGVMTMERLADFGAAWRAGDVDRLMSFSAEAHGGLAFIAAYRKVHGDITQPAPGR